MARNKIGNVYPADEYLLARCAPAGYGLGRAALLTDKDDINTILANGWYHWSSDSVPANVPTLPNTGYMNTMRVWTNDGGVCCQELMDMSDSTIHGSKIQRTIYGDSSVYDWEWVNPPMMVGYEYRTTERWQGKPVYTSLINCGAMPNADSVIIAHGCDAIAIIRCCGTSNTGGTIPYRWNDNYLTVSADRTNIHLCTNTDFSSQSCTVQLWYTKT